MRVRIYGPLEARLQSVDRVVLGGLVEGIWPPETRTDPWLSRPMRHALGLDLPERRIGLSAHDFAQALGAREVILTQPAKLAGAPTVASRFVQRLAAVAGEARWSDGASRAASAISTGRARSTGPSERAAPSSGPRRSRRATRGRRRSRSPRSSSWLRDPYTIYAKHILQAARRSTPVDTPPGARRPRHRDPRRASATSPSRSRPPCRTIPLGALLAHRAQAFRRARGLSGGARVLVAALPAHRALVRRLGARAPRQRSRALHAEIARHASRSRSASAHVHAAHARRPHRAAGATAATPSSTTRPARPPTEKQVRVGPLAAAHARSRDPARRRLSRHPGRRLGRASSPTCRSRRRARRARDQADRFQGRRRRTPRPTARSAS